MSDSEKQAFTLLLHKKQKFIALIKQALASTTIDLTTLPWLSGKCISLALAVPGARLYTNKINQAISCAIGLDVGVDIGAELMTEKSADCVERNGVVDCVRKIEAGGSLVRLPAIVRLVLESLAPQLVSKEIRHRTDNQGTERNVSMLQNS